MAQPPGLGNKGISLAATRWSISARQLVSLIAMNEPGMIGIMEPNSWRGNGHPGGLRMPGFLTVGNVGFGARWGEFRGSIPGAVQYQAIGVAVFVCPNGTRAKKERAMRRGT